MNALAPAQPGQSLRLASLLPLGVGLLAMYLPTFIDVADIFWRNERGTAGPLILMICAWIAWKQRAELIAAPPEGAMPRLGMVVLAIGLIGYVIGRSQEIHLIEVGSLIPVMASLLLIYRGMAGLRAMWFPLFFLLFVVPLPGSLLDAILLPLKQQVSIASESVMYWLGFPVARSGVVLNIGPYQLLIADACSGLSSMISLTGIGLVFVYLARNPGWAHNAILLIAVLPIAFIANIMRVCLLMWVTYAYGDGAGRAFHDQAGYLEIVLAFAMFFGFDLILAGLLRVLRRGRSNQSARQTPAGIQLQKGDSR